MKSQYTRAYQALRRVDDWVGANPTLVPADVQPQVAALNVVTAALGTQSAAQDENRRREAAGNVSVKELRRELRVHHIAPLARVARLVLTETPALRAAFRLPKRRASGEALIAAAQAMAKIGQEHEQLFAQHGLSATFVADLLQQATALKQAIDDRATVRSAVAAATKEITTQVLAGRKTVHSLDVALVRILRHNPAALASWRSAKRITLKGVLPKHGATMHTTAPGTMPVDPSKPVALSNPVAPGTTPVGPRTTPAPEATRHGVSSAAPVPAHTPVPVSTSPVPGSVSPVPGSILPVRVSTSPVPGSTSPAPVSGTPGTPITPSAMPATHAAPPVTAAGSTVPTAT